jgi:UDP:flavonoid glycosyltransferase YjiC (YdhE family)
MHATLATMGTDGNVFQFVGLGVQLQARGHQVTLAAPEPHRDLAADLGLGFRPLVTAEEAGRMLADPDLWHPLRSRLRTVRQPMVRMAARSRTTKRW